MKKFLLASAALMVVSGVASAADMPIKGPPMMRPAFSWTGCYVGAHVGWLAGSSNITDESYYDSGATFGLKADSFAGGGQIGCNWQDGSFVWGIEADGSWTDASRSARGYYAVYDTKWDAVGTIRGRYGIAVDRTLAYVTAGLAWANVKTVYNTNGIEDDGLVASDKKWGWTAGVGVEHALGNNWSIKVEGLYIRLRDRDSSLLPVSGGCTDTNDATIPCTFTFDHEAWTVRVGANYKFGGMGGY